MFYPSLSGDDTIGYNYLLRSLWQLNVADNLKQAVGDGLMKNHEGVRGDKVFAGNSANGISFLFSLKSIIKYCSTAYPSVSLVY